MRGIELQYMVSQHSRGGFDLFFALVVEVRQRSLSTKAMIAN